MPKKEWELWEAVIEAVAVAALLVFFGLQIYYGVIYESSFVTIGYHLLSAVLLYAGLTVLQMFPEFLNGRNSEPLQGMVRIYAIRMVRNIKLLLILGIVFPSAADVLGITANAAYSFIISGGVLLDIGYYIYRIYQYNTKKKGR